MGDTRADGLTSERAQELLAQWGANELERVARPSLLRAFGRQLVHPLGILLWAAAMLSALTGSISFALVTVIVLAVNSVFAFVQELQAERAVEAMRRYLPSQVRVRRDGAASTVDADTVVPGDIMLVSEGERVCADGVVLRGAVDIDASPLTGESNPVTRNAEGDDAVRSGTLCVAGDATVLVTATGMRTELGRIAALSQHVRPDPSPLELQVRDTAILIAKLSIVLAIAFVPIGFLAGLPIEGAIVFAIGLLIAIVPEGLLPAITLALALGVRVLARQNALVKRLSAVETLGSTNVICTDKTGTLTENRLSAAWMWTLQGGVDEDLADQPLPDQQALLVTAVLCNDADIGVSPETGDSTEIALLRAAASSGIDTALHAREAARHRRFSFDPTRRLMCVVICTGEGAAPCRAHVKGAPEAVLDRCRDDGMPEGWRTTVEAQVRLGAGQGLRMLAFAARDLDHVPDAGERDATERGLTFLGLVALEDRLRDEVPAAVRACRQASIRILVITGDHALTALAVSRRAGVADEATSVLLGADVDAMTDDELGAAIAGRHPIIFARASPENKLRIARQLQRAGSVVAMTGNGVNDAPALHQADIGVAMGRSGTDVAREASAMVLTDDNFATIANAVREGRRMYENMRKFIVYVFAHSTPEIAPFVLFALSGGTIPLPLTAAQILAIELGTETVPALALSREPAEPDVMSRTPRPRSEPVITREMLVRAYVFYGLIATVLVMSAYFTVLLAGGWSPGAATEPGSPLHHLYQQATTITMLGIVACQLGAAVACRTERASLRAIGFTSNPALFWGLGFSIAVALAVAYVPALQLLFGTAAVTPEQLALVLPFPFVVWGADELRRWRRRRAARSRPADRAAG